MTIKMKYKNKPKKPERITNYQTRCYLTKGITLAEMMAKFKDTPPDQTRCEFSDTISNDYGDWGEVDPYFYSEGLEPEANYLAKLNKYEKELAIYNKWYEENKEKIAEDQKTKKEKKKIKDEQNLQKEIEMLAKEEERIKNRKRLVELKKKKLDEAK